MTTYTMVITFKQKHNTQLVFPKVISAEFRGEVYYILLPEGQEYIVPIRNILYIDKEAN